MSWNTIDAATRKHLELKLTPGQTEVLTLHLAGCSQRRISTMLNISRTTTRDRLRTALNTLATLTQEHTV